MSRSLAWRAALAGALLGVVSCADSVPSTRQLPPSAEFLFAAGDSTWWVRSSPEGLRVRSAPILLTHTDGRFYEVFIAEDGAEYEDATLVSGRVYARDVVRRDSMVIFDDPTAQREITRWKRQHPDAVLLDPEEAMDAEEPATAITDEIEIVDVHGPWVTVQHSLDIDVDGRRGHRHARRRAVVDVRTGRRGSLATLFGPQAAARAIRAGRAAFSALKDSVSQLEGERADRARETLGSFQFDVTSFTLTDIDRRPAVSFLVPGNDVDGSALVLNLPPVEMPAQPWWPAVEVTLPQWAADSTAVRWTRGSYVVHATPIGDGRSLSLTVRDVRDSVNGEPTRAWPVATVVSPAYQLIALDEQPLSRELRAGLAAAFDAASAVDGLGQRVRFDLQRRPPIRVIRTVMVAPFPR